jgi:dienelactone hydrolase
MAALVAGTWLLTPAASPAGFQLYKAKETATTFDCAGAKIKVWQFTPTEGKGPFPGVVLLYGLDGLDDLPRAQFYYKLVAGKIAEKGYVVHFVHYFDSTPMEAKAIGPLKQGLQTHLIHGGNGGDGNGGNGKPDPKLEKLYRTWMTTVKEGICNLQKTDLVNKDRIGVVGLSMGGFLGTSVMVEHPELKLLALVNVFGGLPPQQHDQLLKSKIKFPPVLIMGGEEDEVVPEKIQRELLEMLRATKNCAEAHFYSNVGHAFFDKERGVIDQDLAMNEALPTALRFLKRHVQGPKIEKK